MAEVKEEVVVDHGMDTEEEVLWDHQDPQEAILEEGEDEVDAVILRILIPWLATSAGCMAIWPVTVPKLEQRSKEVAMQALPKGNSVNPGKKAQKDVEEVGQFDSGASMSYMTKLGMNTQ